MFFKSALISCALGLYLAVSGASAAPQGNVFTASRVFHSLIDEAPFLVDMTTVVIWTQSAETISAVTSGTASADTVAASSTDTASASVSTTDAASSSATDSASSSSTDSASA